jgi:2'-5' RNA ligase
MQVRITIKKKFIPHKKYNQNEHTQNMSGAHLKKSPNSQCVINLVPPRELWYPIQSIRTRYIPEARCGPHISFIDPFVSVENYDEVAELLQKELVQIEPFTVTLDKFNYFKHKSSCTLYLEPTVSPVNGIEKLLEHILRVVPQCDDQIKKSSNGVFVPHISVAKFKKFDQLLSEKENLEKNWNPITFVLKEIYLLHRIGDNPFEVKHVVHLGSSRSEPSFGPSTATEDSQTAKTVVIFGLPKQVIRSNEELMNLIKHASLNPKYAEIIMNPNGNARPLGIVEFESKQEATEAIQSYKYQPYSGSIIYLRPLECMFFPDVIGGSCSLKSVQESLRTVKK